MSIFESAIDRFFTNDNAVKAAKDYCAMRRADFSKLQSEMQFTPVFQSVFGDATGHMRCKIYGHSILIEVIPGSLHAFPVFGEVMLKGAADIETIECFEQFAAYVLAVNW